MPRVLVVTNDFPPALGGIQSYVRDFVATLPPEDVTVIAAPYKPVNIQQQWDDSHDYEVLRWHTFPVLPGPRLSRFMQETIRDRGIDTVWFGAAAPWAILGAAAKKAGATKAVASTHGHEVGFSMLPGLRQSLRRIGHVCDELTYISHYTLSRFGSAFGDEASWTQLPSGVDTAFFRPSTSAQIAETRRKFGIGDAPLIVCISRLVPRKGQDQLIRAMKTILRAYPDAKLLIGGSGHYETTLKALAEPVRDSVIFTGALEREDMRDILAAATVSAVPCRTRGKGLDVEGLGIVFLEAQACGVPVIAGDSGGAPETVTPDSGLVVSGRDQDQLARAVIDLLSDPARRESMGKAGRAHVEQNWTWDVMGARFRRILGYPE